MEYIIPRFYDIVNIYVFIFYPYLAVVLGKSRGQFIIFLTALLQEFMDFLFSSEFGMF